MEKESKNLAYWKANASEDYMKTPISVLRYITELESALSMSGVSVPLPCVDREKELEESLNVLLGMASTWGKEWFNTQTWEKVEKARKVLAGNGH